MAVECALQKLKKTKQEYLKNKKTTLTEGTNTVLSEDCQLCDGFYASLSVNVHEGVIIGQIDGSSGRCLKGN